jgi:hypothetical protein
MRQGSGKPPPPQPLEIPGDELGRLIEQHLKPLPTRGADADDEMAKEALKTALKAFMETDAGKKLADALTSKKGLTTIAIVLPALVAALIAEKASAPTLPLGKLLEKIPGVPKGTELDFSLEGPLARPTGGMLTFKLPLGGAAAPAGKQGGTAPKPPLPSGVRAAAAAVDARLITNSVVSPFLWEWETAGPDEEDAKAKPYREARDVRFSVDARLVAYRVAEAILGQPGKASVEVFAGDDWRWHKQQQKRWRDPETHRLASGLPKISKQLVDDMVRAIVAAGRTPQASAVEFTARPYVFAYVPVGK